MASTSAPVSGSQAKVVVAALPGRDTLISTSCALGHPTFWRNKCPRWLSSVSIALGLSMLSSRSYEGVTAHDSNRCTRCPVHTVAKWPTFPQFKHVWLEAGHRCLACWRCPQYLHWALTSALPDRLLGVETALYEERLRNATSRGTSSWANASFVNVAASNDLQIRITLSSESWLSKGSRNTCFCISLSHRPHISLSRILPSLYDAPCWQGCRQPGHYSWLSS